MRAVYISALTALAFMGASGTASAGDTCSNTEAAQAYRVIYSIGNWGQLNTFYKHFVQCDDGIVAEGISDRVSNFLTNQWDRVGDLKKLTDLDQKFGLFVLYHIDTTMRHDQAKAVIDSATNHCPEDAGELCAKIVKEVQDSTN